MAGNQNFTLVKLSPILASCSPIHSTLSATRDSNNCYEFKIRIVDIFMIKSAKPYLK